MRKRRLIKSKFYRYTPQHAADDMAKHTGVYEPKHYTPTFEQLIAMRTTHYTPQAVCDFIDSTQPFEKFE